MKAGWWEAPHTLRDLAEAISIFIFFCQYRPRSRSSKNITSSNSGKLYKNITEDIDSSVQNEPIIDTTTSQDKEAHKIEEDKPSHPSDDFCFPKRKFGKRQRLCQAPWFRQFECLHYDKQYVDLIFIY